MLNINDTASETVRFQLPNLNLRVAWCVSSHAYCRYARQSTDLKFRKPNIYNIANRSEKFQVR